MLYAFFFCSFLFSQKVSTEKLDSLFHYFESKNQSIGSVSVFHHGEEVYFRNFGQALLPSSLQESKSLYHIGSVTKVFTSVLIWKLIENKQLQLQTPLSDFYPAVPNAELIQIKHLLSHTSGLARNYWKSGREFQPLSDKKILKNIIQKGFLFPPEKEEAYSNNAFYLLKGIIEQKYEKSFAQVVLQEITQPLQLHQIYSIQNAPNDVWNSFHYNYKRQEWQVKRDFYYPNIIGVGDMVASMTHLNSFMYQLMKGRILHDSTVQKMIPAKDQDFGMNFQSVDFFEYHLFGHGGTTVGTHTLMAYEPISQLQFAIAINGEMFPHNALYISLLKVLFYQTLDLPYCLHPNDLTKFSGVFVNPELKHQLQIKVHEFAGIYGEDKETKYTFPLKAKQENVFEYQQLVFQFSDDLSAFTLFQNGENYVFKKIK